MTRHPDPSPAPGATTRVVLVTGMSGAGRSSALKVLEDLGYEAIDNLPLSLLGRLLFREEEAGETMGSALAIDVDIRTRGFQPETFVAALASLAERRDLDVTLVFFDCDDDILSRRFTETRRRHPLAEDRPLSDGINHERALIAPVRERADLVVDTSQLNLPELRALLKGHFRLAHGPGLALSVMSFSYARGVPRDADLVFDARFLSNPFYVEELRHLTGVDAKVEAHIMADPAFAPFFDSLSALLISLLPHYAREGKTYLTIAFGCTGGLHRSVYLAERIASVLERGGWPVTVRHRDLEAARRRLAQSAP